MEHEWLLIVRTRGWAGVHAGSSPGVLEGHWLDPDTSLPTKATVMLGWARFLGDEGHEGRAHQREQEDLDEYS
jgi:hypothetical protein